MLASVLNSDRAIEVNVKIVKLFNSMRATVHMNQQLLLKLEKIDNHIQKHGASLKEHEEEIAALFSLMDQLHADGELPKVPMEPIGFRTAHSGK
jgi:hypothetical protein